MLQWRLGKLRAIKLGSRTIILADELRRFLGELPSAKAEEGVRNVR
jgi:hypothetical protein